MAEMEFKGTPGPWFAEVLGEHALRNERPWIGTKSGRYSALSCGDTQEESVANARLIAAAPELLEACRQLVIAQSGFPMTGIQAEQYVQNALAAIDKAIGA